MSIEEFYCCSALYNAKAPRKHAPAIASLNKQCVLPMITGIIVAQKAVIAGTFPTYLRLKVADIGLYASHQRLGNPLYNMVVASRHVIATCGLWSGNNGGKDTASQSCSKSAHQRYGNLRRIMTKLLLWSMENPQVRTFRLVEYALLLQATNSMPEKETAILIGIKQAIYLHWYQKSTSYVRAKGRLARKISLSLGGEYAKVCFNNGCWCRALSFVRPKRRIHQAL